MKVPKPIKYILWVFLLPVIITSGWLTGYRLLSNRTPVETVQIGVIVTPPNAENRIRIGAFNIAHGRGPETGKSNHAGGSAKERLRRLDKIAEIIQAQNLDILVLNEVDFSCTWSQGVNQALYLAEKAGFPYFTTQKNMDFSVPFYQVSIGNAVLSKYPVTGSRPIPYPALNWRENIFTGHKNGSYVDVLHPSGLPLRVFPIHLEYRDQQNRQEAINLLLEHKTPHSIWAGDFNASLTEDSVVSSLMKRSDTQTTMNARHTYPTASPTRTIDWIIVPKPWQEVSSDVILDSYSDHAFIVSEWEMPP